MSERPLVVARELTKIHEEFVRTTTTAGAGVFRSREVIGEFTLVFGAAEPAEDAAREPLSDETIWAELGRLAEEGQKSTGGHR